MNKKFAVVILLAVLFSISRARAATEPEIFITWRAFSYAPSDFRGKILPSPRTPIAASFTVLENGKAANLSQETVYWYLDNALVYSGRGLQTASLSGSEAEGSFSRLRVQINDYRGRGELVVKTILIPTVSPEAVIAAPFSGDRFSAVNVRLDATPYFFNVTLLDHLLFIWNVNGQTPTSIEDPAT
ncbi:MAG: hypothetical protein AAB967_04460, partial [Patescibacteria group bacterium]